MGVIALIPFAIAVLLLIVFRQPGRVVGCITMASTILIVCTFAPFYLPPLSLLSSLATGIAESLSLLTILLPAILLYQIQRVGGAIPALIEGITHISPDQDLLVLLLVFGIAPLLDSMCGMNVGIFVIAPVLLTLGFSPIRVACLCMCSLITGTWAMMGVVIQLLAHATNIPATVIGSNSALLLMPTTICVCIAALWFCGNNRKRIIHAWLPIMGTAAILTGGGWITTHFTGVELAGLLTDLGAILFLALLSRIWIKHPIETYVYTHKERVHAILPYITLTILLFLSRIITPVAGWLQSHAVISAPQIHLLFPVLYFPGIWMLAMVCLAGLLLHITHRQAVQALSEAWKQFTPSALSLVFFLGAAQLMQSSGMIVEVGRMASPLGTRYIWITPLIGAFAGWLTGATIPGNALFSTLQQSIALRNGLSTPWIIASQTVSCSLGKIVSPTSAAMIGSASGIPGQEGIITKKVASLALLSLALSSAVLDIATGHMIETGLLILVICFPLIFLLHKREQRAHISNEETQKIIVLQ